MLNKNDLFHFLKSSNEKMSGMIKILNTIVDMVPNATTGQYMVKYTGKKMIGTGDAVYASCAVPFIFPPFFQNDECYLDGGIMRSF